MHHESLNHQIGAIDTEPAQRIEHSNKTSAADVAAVDQSMVAAWLRRLVVAQDQPQSLLSLNLCLSVLVLQPGKCLYTSIRELVENSLDAAESIGQLPDIAITL